MRRVFAFVLAGILLLFCGCSGISPASYSVTYYTLFDTVTVLTAQSMSKADFDEDAARIYGQLLDFHKLFDIYNSYEGVVNLKYVNENAANAPVEVDSRILALLSDCKQIYTLTGGKVNVAMGSVLKLWHEARTQGIAHPESARLPDESDLLNAALHTSLDAVILDEKASTVYFSDPRIRLDVGAVAKGWATQKVAQTAPRGWLLNVGGNVFATGPKAQDQPWKVAVQDPSDPDEYLHLLSVSGGCIATSGDYQRTYTVAGKAYHHIIDPATCFPAALWRSVTVICPDSGMADALSTALFLVDRQTGQRWLEQYGAEAMWVDSEGNRFYSSGFSGFIRT